jgi:hypothetical protein
MMYFQTRAERPEDTAEGRAGLMEGWSADVDGRAAAFTPKYDLN